MNGALAQWSSMNIQVSKDYVNPFWCTGADEIYTFARKSNRDNGTWLEEWDRLGKYDHSLQYPFNWSEEWMTIHGADDYVCFSEMGIFFSRSSHEKGKMESQILLWDGHEETLIPTGNNGSQDVHPAWDSKTQTLFFSSNRAGGFGGFDIYRIHLTEGRWSEWARLGVTVNSIYDDKFCSVWKGDLYFSSMNDEGNRDIYKSPLEGAWSMKWQMEYPINSEYEELQWVMFSDDYGGLVSSRESKKTQLYCFKKQQETKRICLFTENDLVVKISGMNHEDCFINTNRGENCMEIPIERQLTFSILDLDGHMVPYGFLIIRDENGRPLAQGVTDKDGKWSWAYFPFQFSGLSLLNVMDESLLASNQKEWFGSITSAKLKGELFFENGSSELNDVSERSLEDWVVYLKGSESQKVLIVGYADKKGSDHLNQKLSMLRALKVQDYLLSRGVSISQLELANQTEGASRRNNSERKVTLSLLP
jgi:outer membrane protein OmpA-like peptidoglycan-associated protein